jgi:hypothetical protein
MTLNYRVIVERYSFPNGVVGGLIPVMKSSLYFIYLKIINIKKNYLGR